MTAEQASDQMGDRSLAIGTGRYPQLRASLEDMP
jgi:hypothetical protein